MKGNAEFLILFIPFLLIGIGSFYVAWFYSLESILINPVLVFGVQLVLSAVGIFCAAVDIFAIMVQYVNWKYYKEE
ncbi:MAG: hypothetical protein HON47_00595 [Candidatus Diapherotrites archaeon]|jgi:hypothetical protein|uniref:Uncharacterized protein n=1 Tax=Candidatus Iainarchaeum sp. TaxID=3101447 RepID=A0A8T5GE85_9ARCH|nr:hypothetical protein [Candidatus Diapherotrites archaeon]MBT7240926.1 hypothetical protein [Candidatus Diapherotrites archaeon]